MERSDANEPMARDAAAARQKRYTLRPRYRLDEAPADVLQRLQAAAQAEGHTTWASHGRCTACAQVSPCQERIAGEVEGTTVWVPMCPTAGAPASAGCTSVPHERCHGGSWPSAPQNPPYSDT